MLPCVSDVSVGMIKNHDQEPFKKFMVCGSRWLHIHVIEKTQQQVQETEITSQVHTENT